MQAEYVRLEEGQHLQRLLKLSVEETQTRDVATLRLKQGIDDLHVCVCVCVCQRRERDYC